MPPTWSTLIPPLLVIGTTILFRHIHLSLFIGIITASLVASDGNIGQALSIGLTAFWDTINNIDNLYLYSFLFGIGILVSFFTAAGFALSFAQAVTQKIRSARQAQYAAMIVSCLLLIDDYLSILTIGCVMGPLIDRFRIAREKLAFLVHSFAGPVVILAPISSWVAVITAYMDKAGIGTISQPDSPLRIVADPFFMYLQTIPFTLYSFLIIISAWIIVHYRISFGPMRIYEQQAATKQYPDLSSHEHANMRDLLIPISILTGGIMFGLPFAGGYYLFGGNHSLIESIKYNPHPFLVMLCAVLAAIAITVLQALYKRRISITHLWPIAHNGFHLMAEAIGMVFLASILSGLLANYVGTGQYIASLLGHVVSFALLPVIFFITSLACTFATGSAWGTFALIIPIAVPMLTSLYDFPLPSDPQSLPLLIPVLGAIFSGSVCGDHISPLSETTTMTATSTQITVMRHTYTQIFYALPAIIGSIIGYLVMGLLLPYVDLWINVGISLSISCIICLATLWLLYRQNNQKKEIS